MKINKKLIRLNLELKDEHLTKQQKMMLKRYGESLTGNSISRDIIIPVDMPLHNLHYAIQKLFGWQKSHLRSFYLPEDLFKQITNSTVKGWANYVGLLFQPPSECESDIFWDDDYDGGNFESWLKRKYSGPYNYGGHFENYEVAGADVNEFINTIIDVSEPFSEYYQRSLIDIDTQKKILRKAPISELTLEEMYESIYIEADPQSLLESLLIDKLLAAKEEEINMESLQPITRELIYVYDFGADWTIKITKHDNCNDLLEANLVSELEIEEAMHIALKGYKPVCIHRQGKSVLDDVGGLSGFADFLEIIYEGTDKEEKANMIGWANTLGWKDKLIPFKKVL